MGIPTCMTVARAFSNQRGDAQANWRRAALLTLAMAGCVGPSLADEQRAGDKPPMANAAPEGSQATQRSLIEEHLGVRVEGLHLSSAGYMVDFRYRVLDPVKAAPLLDRKLSPYLLDEASGARLGVPDAPKVGQLRPTSRGNVIPGRTYFMLFANPGRYLKSGSKVTLVAGNALISHLTVD